MTKVLEILANKVSRKASIIALAMVLIYLIAATPNVATAMAFIVPIAGLAVFFTFLQWILDAVWGRRGKGKKNKDDEVKEDSG